MVKRRTENVVKNKRLGGAVQRGNTATKWMISMISCLVIKIQVDALLYNDNSTCDLLNFYYLKTHLKCMKEWIWEMSLFVKMKIHLYCLYIGLH